MGHRGLMLLEAHGVRLLNGFTKEKRHQVTANIWWNLPTVSPGKSWFENTRPNGCVTVGLLGRIDQSTCGLAEAALLPCAYNPRTNGLVIDLERVDYVASAGLRMLMLMAQVARINRYEIVLACPNSRLAEILKIARFDRLFRIFESCEQAEAAVDTGLAAPRQ